MNFQELESNDFIAQLKDHQNAVLIDVREAYEFEDHNIGGKNIPMAEVLKKTEEIKDYEAVFLCCKSGKRSKAVAYHLSKVMPNHIIISLSGGIQAYQ